MDCKSTMQKLIKNTIPQKHALFSCSNNKGIVELASFFLERDYNILSTGGTLKYLQNSLSKHVCNISDVNTVTKYPEMLEGRVKTLHPAIHGGVLADRDIKSHLLELDQFGFPLIDVVVSNFYPFKEVIKKNKTQSSSNVNEIINNIDIGGVALTRAAGKNYKNITIITDPDQYKFVIDNFDTFTLNDRMKLARDAFRKAYKYDELIHSWYTDQLENCKESVGTYNTSASAVTRVYKPTLKLKYGTNPHQILSGAAFGEGAFASTINDSKFPFNVLNGELSYINLLDAINGWQLVNELKNVFGTAAAASYKHTSPAGVAILTNNDNRDGFISDCDYVYRKARNCDPLSSYGDFIAISGIVDKTMAQYIYKQVSDGVVAYGVTPDALSILSKKKKGKYVILQGEFPTSRHSIEYRELFNISIAQPVNTLCINWHDLAEKNRVTRKKDISSQELNDLMLANTCLKYAQSNNVSIAYRGHVIGISAGQQSRIHSVRLATHKSNVWLLRESRHVKDIIDSHVCPSIKGQQRVNLTIRLIEHVLGAPLTTQEILYYKPMTSQFDKMLDALTKIKTTNDGGYNLPLAAASDAFFPFRDNIDCLSGIGVSVIGQPGGSIKDKEVIDACNEYGITMVMHGKRVFTH